MPVKAVLLKETSAATFLLATNRTQKTLLNSFAVNKESISGPTGFEVFQILCRESKEQ